MPWNNADFAVTLPDRSAQNAALANQLYERGERRRLQEEREQKEQLQRQDALTKYVGDQFDDPNFLTGTSYDPVINNKLAESKQKYADILRKNPMTSMPELQFMMSKDLASVSNMAATIKNVRTSVEAQTQEFDKLKGIDGKAVRMLALNNFLYKTDPKTGKKTLKDVTELDPNKNYVAEVMEQHPEVYLNENEAWGEALKNTPTIGVGNTVATAHAGVRRKTKYAGKIYPFQQVLTDEKGQEIADASGRAQYGLRSQVAKIDGKPIVLDGKPLQIMDDDVYSSFVSNPAINASLLKGLKNFNAEQTKNGKPVIRNGTPEAELIKNHLLHERLKDERAPDFKHEDITTEASFLEKQQAGIPLRVTMSSEDRELLKANKETQRLHGSEIGVVLRGAALDKSVLEGATTEPVNGKTMYNILNAIGDLKLGFNAKHEPVYAKALYVDPDNPGAITVKDANDNVTTYKGQTLRGFAKRIAAHNGSSVDKVEKLLNELMDKGGNVKVNPENELEASIRKDIEQKKGKTFLQSLNPFLK